MRRTYEMRNRPRVKQLWIWLWTTKNKNTACTCKNGMTQFSENIRFSAKVQKYHCHKKVLKIKWEVNWGLNWYNKSYEISCRYIKYQISLKNHGCSKHLSLFIKSFSNCDLARNCSNWLKIDCILLLEGVNSAFLPCFD